MPLDFNKKQFGYGHNSQNDEHKNHTLVDAARPLIECLKFIPASFLWTIQTKHPKECCQQVSNLTMETYKTKPTLDHADLYVFECGCGNRHRRLLLETGAVVSGQPQVARKGDVNVRN